MTLTHEQKAIIAKRVDAGFAGAKGWTKGVWASDVDGKELKIDHIAGRGTCFCLGGLILAETADLLGKEVANSYDEACTVAIEYVRIGSMNDDEFHFEFEALTAWNDSPERTFDEVRTLTSMVATTLQAAAAI